MHVLKCFKDNNGYLQFVCQCNLDPYPVWLKESCTSHHSTNGLWRKQRKDTCKPFDKRQCVRHTRAFRRASWLGCCLQLPAFSSSGRPQCAPNGRCQVPVCFENTPATSRISRGIVKAQLGKAQRVSSWANPSNLASGTHFAALLRDSNSAWLSPMQRQQRLSRCRHRQKRHLLQPRILPAQAFDLDLQPRVTEGPLAPAGSAS